LSKIDPGMPQARVSPDLARAGLLVRLRERRPEIERTVMTRVYGVSDPTMSAHPGYAEGLRAAVSTAVGYGLSAIEQGEGHPLPVPAGLLAQARNAARRRVSLDAVLRRYFAGYTLLGDFVMGAAEEDGSLGAGALQNLLRAQAGLFERLVTAVTEEYTLESESWFDSAEARRADQVERLLAGELIDTSKLPYEFASYHLGVIADGAGSQDALRGLAGRLDCRLLLVARGEGAVWAWLGGRKQTDAAAIDHLARRGWPPEVALAIGEPGHGLAGWRLTHQQAQAALPIARRRSQPVRYAEVPLLASGLQDDLLKTSLRQLYLDPLAEGRDGGASLRRTLRAYFAAERNLSSAAAILGVSRRTVANRLHTAETLIGRPLGAASTELDVALRLADADSPQGG
jgi:PucR C-terminal helix-turn-helix domain/GGDEF-like domain